jgi:2-C-methyl-D-erythritol 4-phosphate cytidylyltransferase/2-C-methyl-D-erythritol 2,4-cyclodiphosphate synthase
MSAAGPWVAAILAAGGRGVRLGGGTPKQLRALGASTMLEASARALLASPDVRQLVVALPLEALDSGHARRLEALGATVVAGGERRQDSVALAFDHVAADAAVVLVHDAARPFVSHAVVERVARAAAETGAAIAAVPVHDTVKVTSPDDGGPVIVGTIDRTTVFLAQTPQGFRRDVLARAVALGRSGVEATDEAMLVEQTGHHVRVVEGDPRNRKITTEEDWAFAEQIIARTASESTVSHLRIGTGYDLHRLGEGRRLLLGGVEIPHAVGLLGHSDADVVCHAVTDAILGAANAGDIGGLFPDTDPTWKDADSVALLRAAVGRVHDAGYRVVNIDIVVIAERPKIGPYRAAIAASLAEALSIEPACVSVKGKTNEGCGEIGRGEAIAVHAVALLDRA